MAAISVGRITAVIGPSVGNEVQQYGEESPGHGELHAEGQEDQGRADPDDEARQGLDAEERAQVAVDVLQHDRYHAVAARERGEDASG